METGLNYICMKFHVWLLAVCVYRTGDDSNVFTDFVSRPLIFVGNVDSHSVQVNLSYDACFMQIRNVCQYLNFFVKVCSAVNSCFLKNGRDSSITIQGLKAAMNYSVTAQLMCAIPGFWSEPVDFETPAGIEITILW